MTPFSNNTLAIRQHHHSATVDGSTLSLQKKRSKREKQQAPQQAPQQTQEQLISTSHSIAS